MVRPSDLPKVCVCIGPDSAAGPEALALELCDRGESFFELRIDLLADPSSAPRIIRRIRERKPDAVVMATCRRSGNGGRFDGSIEEQVAALRDAVSAGAGLVDVEIETIEQDPRSLDPFREAALTVASYHNFDETPDLAPVQRRLRETGADISKIATKVRRPSDNLKLLKVCEGQSNAVVAGMGEAGAAARLLSPGRGGLFTYAAPDPHPAGDGRSAIEAVSTAPGQVSASDVRSLYRAASVTPATRVFAVIAAPVRHSKSPLVHNRAFQAAGFDGVYLPQLVEPGDLADFFELMRALPIAGASVTIPHKQSVLEHLDRVDGTAAGIGAVNTIYREGGELVGTNTDALGVTEPLRRCVPLRGSRALVVGNGGAAKAAVVALQQEGAEVTVTGRNADRVKLLARRHGARPAEFDEAVRGSFDTLVQATSVGMLPHVEGNLFPGRVPAEVVFDLVYNPLDTALLKHAAAQGKTVIRGVEMFVEQAAAQFRIWTGAEAPREIMRAAATEPTVN